MTRSSTAAGSAPCMPATARIEPGEDLASRPSGRRSSGTAGAGVADLVAHGEGVEGEVVVGALRGRRRRQDDVGVAGGLVEVRVDADHEVEPVERLVEPVAVGRGQHGVAGDGDQGADRLPSPGRVDLLGERGERAVRPWPRGGRLTRLRQRPSGEARGRARRARGARSVADSGKSAPPGRSRLPVRMLSTSTSQLARVPYSTVQLPMRP